MFLNYIVAPAVGVCKTILIPHSRVSDFGRHYPRQHGGALVVQSMEWMKTKVH